MLEIDIDVGRLAPFLGYEPLEEQSLAHRIDGSDAEHKAHGGIGRRPSALAQDAFGAREPDDEIDCQKIGRILQPLDQPEFMPQLHCHVIGNALRIALRRTFPGELLKPFLRRQAIVQDLGRITVSQFIQRKTAARCDLKGAANGFGIAPEQTLHLGWLFEKPVGVLLF